MTASSPSELGMMETRKSMDFARETDLESPILGNAAFGYIQFAHDLESGNNRSLKMQIDRLVGPGRALHRYGILSQRHRGRFRCEYHLRDG